MQFTSNTSYPIYLIAINATQSTTIVITGFSLDCPFEMIVAKRIPFLCTPTTIIHNKCFGGLANYVICICVKAAYTISMLAYFCKTFRVLLCAILGLPK